MSSENLKLNRQGCFRLYTAARLLIQVYQPWFAQLGITYTQYLVLMVLWEQDAQPLNAISRRLYLESNTLTPLIKRMEAMKMVTGRFYRVNFHLWLPSKARSDLQFDRCEYKDF